MLGDSAVRQDAENWFIQRNIPRRLPRGGEPTLRRHISGPTRISRRARRLW